MNWSDVKTMASAHVDARGAKVMNYDAELSVSIIEFCRFRKWRWRKSTGRVVLTAGTPDYDLTDSAGINAPDLEELENVYLVEGDADLRKLDEITDENDIALALESEDEDEPTGYFRMPGEDMTLILTPTPDAPLPIRTIHWRVPEFASSQPDDNLIPLVPGYLHPTLVKYLEVRLLLYAVGAADDRYTSAAGELQTMMQTAVTNETGG